MNIVVVGAHPDDPESGCGGLALRAVQAGHRVIFLYLTSGFVDKRYGDRPIVEVRESEARAACAVLDTQPHFFRLPDGDVPVSRAVVQRVGDFLRDVQADLVLAHWPVDTHRDHQASGILTTQAALAAQNIALAYYEVAVGAQTFAFEPNRFVDITAVAEQKKQAVDCHVSQNVDQWWHYHDKMERFRGSQLLVDRAEGYYLATGGRDVETLFDGRGMRQR